MAVVGTRLKYYEMGQATVEEQTFTAHYQVETDDAADGPVTILAAGTLPTLWSFLALGNDTSTAFVIGYGRCSPESWDTSRQVWGVEVNYSTKVPQGQEGSGGGGGEIPIHPADKPWQMRQGTEVLAVGVTEDSAGNKIRNSAGDPIDDLEKDTSRVRLQLSKAKRAGTFVPEDELDVVNKLNDAIWWNKLAKHWRCDSVEHELVYYGDGEHYYQCSYVFVYDPAGWNITPLDRGVRDIDGHLPAADGVRFAGVMPLDGTGHFVDVGDDPTYLDYQVYETTNFSVDLGAPTTYFV